ncbi:prolipoprotein diacylglyceryl transferase [Mycoplasmatota bacterium]|nr:prolipoprotein diacylglyceryl transferase [Mycoplasmatota bacterium]
MWYSVGRFFIENTRTESLMFGTIQIARFVSIILIIIGISIFVYRRVKKIYPVRYVEYINPKVNND